MLQPLAPQQLQQARGSPSVTKCSMLTWHRTLVNSSPRCSQPWRTAQHPLGSSRPRFKVHAAAPGGNSNSNSSEAQQSISGDLQAPPTRSQDWFSSPSPRDPAAASMSFDQPVATQSRSGWEQVGDVAADEPRVGEGGSDGEQEAYNQGDQGAQQDRAGSPLGVDRGLTKGSSAKPASVVGPSVLAVPLQHLGTLLASGAESEAAQQAVEGASASGMAPNEAQTGDTTASLDQGQKQQARKQQQPALLGSVTHVASDVALVVEHTVEDVTHAVEKVAHDLLEPDLPPQAARHDIREALRSHHRPVVYFTGVGALIGAALWTWASGTPLKKVSPYTFTVTFPMAEGLMPGVPVRLKGVTIGSVEKVDVNLEQAKALVEVHLGDTFIPREGTKFEYNRTGMLNPQAWIDVTTAPLAGGLPNTPTRPGGRGVAKIFTDDEVAAAALAAAGGNIPAATAVTPLHHHHAARKAAATEQTSSSAAASGSTGASSSTAGQVTAGNNSSSQIQQRTPGSSSTGVSGHAQRKGAHSSGTVADVQAEAAAVNAALGLTADKVQQQGSQASKSSTAGGSSSTSSAVANSSKSGKGALTEQQLKTCARPADVAACRAEGLLVCAGDVVAGSEGGSVDELTKRLVLGNRGPGKIQSAPGYYT